MNRPHRHHILGIVGHAILLINILVVGFYGAPSTPLWGFGLPSSVAADVSPELPRYELLLWPSTPLPAATTQDRGLSTPQEAPQASPQTGWGASAGDRPRSPCGRRPAVDKKRYFSLSLEMTPGVEQDLLSDQVSAPPPLASLAAHEIAKGCTVVKHPHVCVPHIRPWLGPEVVHREPGRDEQRGADPHA
jgi:hypothetical protein